jgi:hypothetical protein
MGAWTDVGVGITLGYLDVENSGGQFYQQGLLRARYRATEKINLSVNGGMEVREVEEGDRNRVTPVFGLALTYTPFEQTVFSVEGSRRVENSASTSGVNVEYTGVTLNARQRFGGHYYLGASAGYQAARYVELTGDGSQRSDEVFNVQPYVRIDLSKTAAVEVGYLFQHDSSTLERFSFRQSEAFVHLNLFF